MSLEVEKSHADGLLREYLEQMVGGDPVLCDESFQNMQTFRCQAIQPTVLELSDCYVGGVLYQSSVHEILADSFRHIARHAERRCRGGREDFGSVIGIRGTRGLRELEGGEVVGCFVAGDSEVSQKQRTFGARTYTVNVLG